jgi:hypothetical protein
MDSRFLKKFSTKEFFSGNGSTTAFALASVPQESEAVQVFLNGLLQEVGATKDYQFSGSTVTFNVAPANAQRVEIHYWKNTGE